MAAILRLIFWPALLLLITVAGEVASWNIWTHLWAWLKADPIDRALWIITVVLLWEQVLKPILRFLYAIYSSRRLVTMRVLLPREEGKQDQEQRTEKDWKEKVAVMEQLIRALWEVKSLNIWSLLHTWIWRFNTISFEMFAEDNVLRFYVVVRKELAGIVEKQVTSFYSKAEVEYMPSTPDIWPKGTHLVGYNMVTHRKFMYPLRVYENMQDDPLNDLANVLSKMDENERAAIQIIINPSFSDAWQKKLKKFASQAFKGKTSHPFFDIPILGTFISVIGAVFIPGAAERSTFAPGAQSGDSFVRMIQPEEELYKRMGEKAGMSGFVCTIRIMASSPSQNRAIESTNNLQVAFNIFKDLYGNWFDNKRMFIDVFPLVFNAPFIYWMWKHRINGFLNKTNLLAERELGTLFHFPDARYNKAPIIDWMSYKVLSPPANLPTKGILLGRNRYRGKLTDIRMIDDDRTRHMYIIGKSGSGKSVMLSFLARQDVARGKGVILIDPHGDLVEDVLMHVPKERAKDIIVFDPADTDRPMGLNMLEAKTLDQKDRAALDAQEIFIKLFGNEVFGPRIQHYFRNACLTLMDDEEEGATLIDVPRMFVDEEFRTYKVGKCRNVVVRSFWDHEYASTGDREKQEMIPYFSAKFGPFITNMTMRNIIGQPKSAFRIREVMDNEKVLLVNLSKGKIGDTNAQLIGLVLTSMVTMGAMSRADMPADQRKDCFFFVDEFQNFATDSFATILSEARKYRLALTMAHQYISQLLIEGSGGGGQNTKLRDAVFGNVGTMLSFKIGAEDAEYMAKEYAPVLSEQDVINVANYKCYIKLNIKNTTSRPFSMETIYAPEGANMKLVELIKEYSRMKYGRKRVFVDQEIEDRIGIK